MVYSALSDDSSTVSQFARRKAITVTTGGTSTPANYQVKLAITYESGMQSDFQDIRFNTKTRDYIDYWIGSKITSTSAVVWVELPDAITNPGSDTIWMYYGNPGLSDGGILEDTMIFGDDFPGSSLDLTKWDVMAGTPTVSDGLTLAGGDEWIQSDNTFDTNHVITFRAQITDIDYVWLFSGYIPATDNVIMYASDTANNLRVKTGRPVGVTEWSTITDYTDAWHTFETYRNGATNIIFKVDGGTEATHTIIPTTTSLHIGLRSYSASSQCDVAWVHIRKYIANEPTVSYGTEQHQRRILQFIG